MAAATEIWLSLPPESVEGLPDTLTYRYWAGEQEFPADPADCAFYVVPYYAGAEVAVRPLARMTGVRVVQTLTAGIDHIASAIPRLPTGTRVCNARGVHDASTAELALALTLGALRDLPGCVRAQDRGEWLPGFRPALADRTVLIVGYGAVGEAVEKRLLPFEVAAVHRVARSARNAPLGPVRPLSEIGELLPLADVVIVATPLTDQTRGLVDADFLARMKDGALLVNVARGAVVDTEALLAETGTPASALGAEDGVPGRLRAALDVTDPEPLPKDHPLWRVPGVLITPHLGGITSAFHPRARRLLVAQLRRWAAGEELENTMAVA
ncbi:2-hydroxyacid dehydrogenase [Streptomyces smyrnaeus]|uniref:2-hydroxyacid dehydrogenase n=1 Tax=Streptomyces TaxID=1883 RepID=UPI001B365A03|nr:MULTISPECIES: 2-hydroxyacid dehydrogenase [unclassified Streptomyces]MBQ0865312.1 2-hydroxyacid dehydrogenase [Streptomyces sp. RK75]MBQ1121815.1 2-hydroxyacid dehydrogenase [Streptomyces sp. B15]MBQ1161504.1 2-hydroxyacid dehydrogenase [Streptomyces sp. A73]